MVRALALYIHHALLRFITTCVTSVKRNTDMLARTRSHIMPVLQRRAHHKTFHLMNASTAARGGLHLRCAPLPMRPAAWVQHPK
eukprot:7488780-Pyramimonas_sp.AAC.1